MPPQLRQRTSRVKPLSYAPSSHTSSIQDHLLMEDIASPTSSTPPVYTIDLSLPPCERYVQVTTDYKHILGQMPCLYDETVEHLRLPAWFFHFLGRLLLRRLYSDEQTAELKGISAACGLPMYLLVAYNVFLDLLMGCTSGGVMVADRGGPTMMHFRTLDWSMPLLRQVIVQFDFVESPGGEVIARTIGYVGFVGVLTGVRKGMSASLNFRPYHNAHGLSWTNIRYYWNTLMVLMGKRPSISTILRDCLLPRPSEHRLRRRLRKHRDEEGDSLTAAALAPYTPAFVDKVLPTMTTSVAYLIFCTGDETLILEKDFRSAKVLRSSSFINTTNHDVSFEATSDPQAAQSQAGHTQARAHGFLQASMQEVVDESIMRKICLRNKWLEWSEDQTRKMALGLHTAAGVRLEQLKEWLQAYPVCNEVTHFVCVMNPREGAFRWVKRFDEGEIEFQY
ncbi:hypothetical protein BDW02DRAFT_574177 [Decorospora gaudefroyi]|uniref:ceramidase n=1 Tax=Decorospora gaudefroyi TaxID=184978 RepID=A0A6A5JY29_9PLEO|nr:hypothetical protein BDW02DRAFT_574177 [Decorospora gaudefroyi]